MESEEQIYSVFQYRLNNWISIEKELPRWYMPVLVLTDGDYHINPFCDKIQVSTRYDIRKYDWNNQFSCDKKVFYWAYLSDVPYGFLDDVKRYQLNNEISKLQKELEGIE